MFGTVNIVRHCQVECEREERSTVRSRLGSMLPDRSSKAQHCKMYCARLVGLVNGGGRAEEGVGGWYRHDTERGHGGCGG